MDEAEFLADRISIMHKGGILVVGSADFIKKKFGVGYHLILISKTLYNLIIAVKSPYHQ